MEQLYIFLLVALFFLAITDLVVGVSNDAVNFLNSAVGSNVARLRTILIIASLGVGVGAIFSSGLMEVARKGIFDPGQFYFDEIMIIFISVMITDILLLDLFNSLALPTSTTVSIVFELLGAAIAVALIKIVQEEGNTAVLGDYINSAKATEIILGILLSVVIAFTIGAAVQWLSRMLFSFQYEKRLKWVGGLFGGLAISAIMYFLLIKGIKGISLIPASFLDLVNRYQWMILAGSFLLFGVFSQVVVSFTRFNLLKIIILIGTFALALAFAGNDLVNFIGVPIAAYQSYELWHASYLSAGTLPSEFAMDSLGGKVETPTYLLVIAGLVMVLTLWLSKKARSVMYTEINLARSGEGREKFEPNFLSRLIVRASLNLNGALMMVMPKKIRAVISENFSKPASKKYKEQEEPAFDLVRAAVNLMVASILISIATNMKLPLSTTYVSFMVAMGTSLADNAWGRESAVYRVAGVFNVIGGWFVTAVVALTAAALFATVIFFGKVYALFGLLIFAGLMLARSFIAYRRSEKRIKAEARIDRTSLITINELIMESSDNISKVIEGINQTYTAAIDGLGLQDLKGLKKNKKHLSVLEEDVDQLKGEIFYFIKSLDENSVSASKFYILILDYLQDMIQSIGYISKNTYSHVNNNHRNLRFNQIRDLKRIDNRLKDLFDRVKADFDNNSFENIQDVIDDHNELMDYVSSLIEKQVARIRSTETSPKNTKLYFSLLLETKDLIKSTVNLLGLFSEFHSNYTVIRK